MARPSWKEYFFAVCELNAKMSTCVKRSVGAIIVDPISKRIIATGFNGAPSKVKHCTADTCLRKDIPSGEQLHRCKACLSGNTKIKLLDGRSVAIKELIGQEVHGYGYDETTGKVVPVLLTNIQQTKIAKTIRLMFTDGSSIDVTEDHRILMRDETYKEAKDIIPFEDSLMPGKWRNSTNPRFNGYEEIFHPLVPSGTGNASLTKSIDVIRKMRLDGIEITEESYQAFRKLYNKQACFLETMISYGWIENFEHFLQIEAAAYGEYQLTHQMVGDFLNLSSEIIHHCDFNPLNNDPTNLIGLSLKEHSSIHSKQFPREFFVAMGRKGLEAQIKRLQTDEEFRQRKIQNGITNMTKNWNNPKFREHVKQTQINNGKEQVVKLNTSKEIIHKRNISLILRGIHNLILRAGKLTVNTYEALRNKHIIPSKEGNGAPFIETILRFFPSVEEAIEKAEAYNHQVSSIEYLQEEEPVYDFTVDTYHNCLVDFGNDTGIFVHNCHSETNCLAQAAKYGIPVNGMVMYCTHKPCIDCTKLLINAGIKTVYYLNDYPSDLTETMVNEADVELQLVHVTLPPKELPVA